MSVWSRLLERAKHAFDAEDTEPELVSGPGACAPDPGDVDFTAAVIGLAAKMARADGVVDDREVAAAAAVFRPPPGEEQNFRRVFALAKQSVHGYESYARRIGKRYRDRPCLREDVLDGLFHIALADGGAGPEELSYLERVAGHLGLSPLDFRRLKAAHLGPDPGDPYAVLGLSPGASLEAARSAWKRLVADTHPDSVQSRGAPAEFVRIAEAKTAALNAAFAAIRAELVAH
jgi:DnaJ like chaperone protein